MPGRAVGVAAALGLLLALSACHLHRGTQRGYLEYSGQRHYEYGSQGQHGPKHRHRSRY